jgi:hypothetical protein
MAIINLKVLIKSLSKVVHADSSWLSSVRQDIGYKCRLLYIGIVFVVTTEWSSPCQLCWVHCLVSTNIQRGLVAGTQPA